MKPQNLISQLFGTDVELKAADLGNGGIQFYDASIKGVLYDTVCLYADKGILECWMDGKKEPTKSYALKTTLESLTT